MLYTSFQQDGVRAASTIGGATSSMCEKPLLFAVAENGQGSPRMIWFMKMPITLR